MRRFLQEYVLGLLASTVMFAALATLATGVLVVGRGTWPDFLARDGGRCALIGTGIGALACAVLALVSRRYSRADGSVPACYGELRTMYDGLRARADVCCPAGSTSACGEIRTNLDAVAHDLSGPGLVGLRWLLATGYVDVWRRLHKVEEGLIEVEPTSRVVASALYDRLRLEDSPIANARALLDDLRQAVGALSPTGAAYLASVQVDAPTAPPASVAEAAGAAPRSRRGRLGRGAAAPPARATGQAEELPAPHDSGADHTAVKQEARAVLRTIRAAIDEWRDDRRGGLVRGRNNLFATVIFTGVTAYTLLTIAVIQEAQPAQIAAAAVFYLVGALVGLFKQLRDVSAADTVLEEDFGLASARLIHTPLFSGLAALGGVVATTMLATVVPTPSSSTTTAKTTTVTSAPSAAPGGTPTVPGKAQPAQQTVQQPRVVPLREIFDLGENPAGILIAAVFGLTPNLLIIRLQRQVEQYKTELKNSSAAEATPSRS